MGNPESAKPVVVGIDGSAAAIGAARWAVDEAASRDVPLRLIHVVSGAVAAADDTGDGLNLGVEYAQSALRTACRAVAASDQPVKVETEVGCGDVTSILTKESRGAAVVCVGSVGIGWVARRVLGCTAAALAKGANCPVAIIRRQRAAASANPRWVAVVVDDDADNDAVLDLGFAEARLRKAPILALGAWPWGLGEMPYDVLDRRLARCVSRYPEVHILPVSARGGAAACLEALDEPIQLAVVGSTDAGQVARLVGPHGHGLRRHAGCSVLVVRK